MILIDTHGPLTTDPNTIGSDAISMYGNEVHVRFEEAQHRYLVQDSAKGSEWFRVPSVTTILGKMLDKSKTLVPWSTRLAMDTMLQRIEPNKTYTQDELNHIGHAVRTAHTLMLDQAGKTGSAAHKWVETYLTARAAGTGYPPPPKDPKVRSCCSAARKWIREVDLRPIAVEKILYSRKFGFIGTTDLTAAAVIRGRSAVVDWKSSNQAHASYGLQLAAYALAWQEMTGTKLEDRWLIRLDKEDSSFEAKLLSPETIVDEQRAFILLAKAYRLLEGIGFFKEQ